MGEIARMSVGEGWAAPCDLTVVACRNYTHATEYVLPVAPSPNLPTQRAVYLYAALCPFEGTVVSLGRGTGKPFEIYGHPDLTGRTFAFTPRPTSKRTSCSMSSMERERWRPVMRGMAQ